MFEVETDNNVEGREVSSNSLTLAQGGMATTLSAETLTFRQGGGRLTFWGLHNPQNKTKGKDDRERRGEMVLWEVTVPHGASAVESLNRNCYK